jgi:hypothetical protein
MKNSVRQVAFCMRYYYECCVGVGLATSFILIIFSWISYQKKKKSVGYHLLQWTGLISDVIIQGTFYQTDCMLW